jgi:Tfp pilus assembly protein PilV
VLAHHRSYRLLVAPLIVILCAPLFGVAAPSVVPPVLERFAGFAGRLEYAGHRTDMRDAPEVRGTAIIADGGFILDERTARYVLHADETGIVVRSGATVAHAADPLDADALVNPWAVAIAALAHGGLTPRGRGAWQTPKGLILYTEPNGSVVGMTQGPSGRLAFTFAAWGDVGGLAIPTRILRLRRGISDASFQIDRLDVVRDRLQTSPQLLSPWHAESAGLHATPAASTLAAKAPSSPPFPWRLMSTLFGFMLLGVAIVAWLRRDAFVMHMCHQRAEDPRAWRSVSSAAYVNADGVLVMEGNDYRVGPEFFARSVEVRHSALFVRVSAPGVTRVLVMPRRLPRPAPVRRRTRRSAAARGLSLIETLVAVAFFTVVIVAAVYPALIAVAQADLVAAHKRAALIAAGNALTDEEQACAYGFTAPVGTTTTTVNGMTVVVTVTDSSVAGARDITVSSSDASGRVLAALATTVGPPVPPPGSGGPPSEPRPPGPAPTPSPTPTSPPSSFGER